MKRSKVFTGNIFLVGMKVKYLNACAFTAMLFFSCLVNAEPAYVHWQSENFAITKPLTNKPGNAVKGRQLVIEQDKGNCLACHVLPVPEERFFGSIGPDLTQVASRLSEAELRLRVVDEKAVNPQTIMPGYYRDPAKLTLVANEYEGKTMLTAQEVEDVVAYLLTLH